jgi:hypothetical protein
MIERTLGLEKLRLEGGDVKEEKNYRRWNSRVLMPVEGA